MSVLVIIKCVQLSLNPVRNEENRTANVWSALMYKIFLYLLIHFCPKQNCLYYCITCCSLKITYSGVITRCAQNMVYLNSGGSIPVCRVSQLTKENSGRGKSYWSFLLVHNSKRVDVTRTQLIFLIFEEKFWAGKFVPTHLNIYNCSITW